MSISQSDRPKIETEIYPNLEFTARKWSDLCSFYSNGIFFFFFFFFFFLFFADFQSQTDVSQHYCENFREFEEIELSAY